MLFIVRIVLSALLQNYFNYAVGKTAMAGRVQEVYNPFVAANTQQRSRLHVC